MALVVEGPPGSGGDLIGGRYRIEARIAKGGMGAVYRAFDHVQQRPLALKRLLADSDGRRRTRMFEREFHTLAGLKHPRIIDVYDYGVDEQGAYYTMELLDGRDLRELAPLPYTTACRYLRDVASSLGLLHARQLLHRDLSPRNVRITSDGRAKLIDFGALTSFGRSATVVGTAPLVPPEALCGAQLDQRADLYAFGALAYWVLTGRHAYDVRAIADLPDAWQKSPPPPSELAAQSPELPPLPKALDDLVLALLSQNPLARPASAAELIGRLSSIGGLAPDTEPLFALSYLHGGHSLGRVRERARLRRRLKRMLSGSGSVQIVQAEAGMGSARILGELAIEARLLGATAIVVDAALHRGTYGVAEQIVHGLLATDPERARAALQEHAGELSRFMPGDSARVTTQRMYTPATRSSADPREARLRTQSALLEWLDRMAAERPLLIAVHGMQHTDDSSASMLSALASACPNRRMLLLLAHNPDEPMTAPAAFASVQETAETTVLRGLTRDEVRGLVEASFGEVPHTERLAAWLHELTGGKPRACRDLMQHLIEQNVIRFADGAWVLPQELSPHELPADIGQALDLRIARLSAEAQRLALALCVHRGTITIDRCLALAELERVRSPFRALIELEQRGVLIASEDRLRFSHAAVREAALHRLQEPERQRLHAQLGTLISREGGSDVESLLDAGWHLLHGGQEGRGADLLAEAGLALSYDADDMPAAIPALEAALAVFRRQDRSKRELARLLGPLAIAGFYTDRRVVETYGEEAVDVMQDVLGLNLARRLAPLLGRRASALLGLGVGLARTLFAVGPRKLRSAFREALMVFITAVCVLAGWGTMTLDSRRARRFARLLEPLRVLGRDHAIAVVHRFTAALTTLPEDRIIHTIANCRSALARLDDPRPIRDMPDKARMLLRGAALYALGSLETFREDPEALHIADQLDTMDIKLFEMFANQIRANYHGLRGEERIAERYRQRVELFAVQAGSSWQAEVWTPASSILYYVTTRDRIGLRRAADQLARLAQEIPSLRLHAQMALASCYMLRGDVETARSIGHPMIASNEPRSHIGWSAMMAGEMWSLCELGEPEQARQLGRRVLALYDAEDRTVSSMVVSVVVQLALIEARLGEFETAAERIDEFLAELRERGGPATRGTLHEARAQVALAAHDPVSARLHLSRMEQWFRPTENPALVARCEQLRRELEAGAAEKRPTSSDALDLESASTEEVRRAMRQCSGREQRFERALELLLEHTGGSRGQLFSYEEGRLVDAASRGQTTPQAVRDRLLQHLAQLERQNQPDVTASASGVTEVDSGVAPRGERSEEHRFFVLAACDGSDRKPVAAAVITVGRRPLHLPLPSMLSTLAEELLERDTVTASASS